MKVYSLSSYVKKIMLTHVLVNFVFFYIQLLIPVVFSILVIVYSMDHFECYDLSIR